jgi:plasmid stabilization system protein ParE
MTFKLRFRPEVNSDAINAYHWYEEKSSGLGDEFLRIFYASAIELIRNPLLYKKTYKDFRRKLLRRFPYAIYYSIEENIIIIFGLFHTARSPLNLEKILKDR